MIQQRHKRMTSSKSNEDFLNRMYANEADKRKKKDKVRKLMKSQEVKECSFKPVTNTKRLRKQKKEKAKRRMEREQHEALLKLIDQNSQIMIEVQGNTSSNAETSRNLNIQTTEMTKDEMTKDELEIFDNANSSEDEIYIEEGRISTTP